MAVVTTNLGTVTAYGDAVAAGYTGTKEEFQALLAKVPQSVTDSANAVQQATEANQGYTELKNTLYTNNIIPNIDWAIGGITSQGGINSTFKYCTRPRENTYLVPVNGKIHCDDGYQIRVVKYNGYIMGVDTFVSDSGWTTGPVAVSKGEYIAPQIRYANDSSTVLEDTSISEHIVWDLRESKLNSLETAVDKNAENINALKNSLMHNIIPDIDWVIGGITSQGSLNSTFKYCIRPNAKAYEVPVNGTIYCDDGFEIRVVRYSQSMLGASNFISDTGWTTEPQSVMTGDLVALQIRNYKDTSTVLTDTSISEHFIYNLHKLALYLNEQAGINSDYRRAYFDTNLHFGEWYSGLNPSYDISTMLAKDITGRDAITSDIIGLYDSLVEDYPDYVSKTDLGLASGTDLNGNPYNIYEYAFIPVDAVYDKHPKVRPTVMLDAGMHGFEKAAVYGLYCFMYDVCHNWDKNPALKNVRFGTNIRIIPVSCPYGFDRNERLNANHINLNRNFETPTWRSISASQVDDVWNSEASGLAPFDQPETAIIRNWLNQYKKSCLAYINLHTNGQYNVPSYYEANACIAISDITDEYYNRIQTVFRKHICEQTLMWTKEWANLNPSTTIGRFQNQDSANTKFGTIQQWLGYTIKQIGICLEGFNGMNSDGVNIIPSMSAQSIKMNSENIGNMVLQLFDEYCRII